MAAPLKPKPLAYVQPRTIPIHGGQIYVYPNGKRVTVHHNVSQFGWGRAAAAPRPNVAKPPPSAADWSNLGKLAAQRNPPAPPTQFAPDSQYLREAGSATFKMNADLQGLQAQGITDAASRQQALAGLAQQQPRDLQQANVNANKQGLFYSSTLGNQRADINAGYVAKQGQVEAQFAASERARAATEAAIRAGYSVDDAARMGEAVDRRIAQDSSAADQNALVPNPAPKPAPRPAPAPRVIHTQRQPTTRGRRPRRRR